MPSSAPPPRSIAPTVHASAVSTRSIVTVHSLPVTTYSSSSNASQKSLKASLPSKHRSSFGISSVTPIFVRRMRDRYTAPTATGMNTSHFVPVPPMCDPQSLQFRLQCSCRGSARSSWSHTENRTC